MFAICFKERFVVSNKTVKLKQHDSQEAWASESEEKFGR